MTYEQAIRRRLHAQRLAYANTADYGAFVHYTILELHYERMMLDMLRDSCKGNSCNTKSPPTAKP